MKRMILTGALALAAGVSSLMAQAAPPKAPAPKSKDELAAVQALFTATRNGPDATIKAAEDLLTKFADTDFKMWRCSPRPRPTSRSGTPARRRFTPSRALEANPRNFQATLMLAELLAQKHA